MFRDEFYGQGSGINGLHVQDRVQFPGETVGLPHCPESVHQTFKGTAAHHAPSCSIILLLTINPKCILV